MCYLYLERKKLSYNNQYVPAIAWTADTVTVALNTAVEIEVPLLKQAQYIDNHRQAP